MTYYRIEYWHTTSKAWFHFDDTTDSAIAIELYNKALAWHYVGIVRLVKVTEDIIQESKP
jgi:hypothetical protein